MRLQLVGLILLRLFIVVDVNHRMLISSKQTILMTVRDGPASAASLDASIHSRMSHHRHHQPIAALPKILYRQVYHFGSPNGSIPSDEKSSEHREKRASGFAEEGMQVSPVLTLTVTDNFNRPLGPTELRVGDSVRFIITLTRDGIYDSLEVTSCAMSTSQTMPDPNAETRVLLIKGCPIQDEVTADSWYWTSEMSTSAAFISNTQAVPIFRLATSEYIYLHCSMKMCFTGSAPCQQPTRDDCIFILSKRKKREDFLPMKKRRSVTDGVTDVNQTLALRVIDPKLTPTTSNNLFEVGTSGFIALIVLVSLIGFVVIVLIIILVVVLVDRRPKRRRRTHPQQFAEQRVTPTATNRRCLTCC